MKILLIYPYSTVRGHDPTAPTAIPPLGLAYVASFLEKDGYEVRILDALALGIDKIYKNKDGSLHFGLLKEEAKDYISNFNPDIVGIQCMYTAYSSDAHEIAKITREINKDVLIVMGGAHASSAPADVLKDFNVDMVVKGEGEITFFEVVKAYEQNKSLLDIPGTVVRRNGSIFANIPRPYIQNLDILPFPARHLLPMEVYFKQAAKSPFNMRIPSTFIVSSRGCRLKCVFCSIHGIWGNTWRYTSGKRVVDEIEHLMQKYGVREIQFVDDNVSMDKQRLVEICDEILRRKIDIKWTTPNGVAIYTLDKETIEKMKQSGCYRLTFGIESGSEKTQRNIGKKINLEKANELIKHANKIGIWTVSTFIIGFPWEERDDVMKTIHYAFNSDLDFAVFYLPMPFPNTKLTNLYKDVNLLHLETMEEWGLFLSGTGGVATQNFTTADLRELQRTAYSKLIYSRFVKFLNPKQWLNKIHSTEDMLYLLRLIKSGISIFIDNLKSKTKVGYRPISIRKENVEDTL